MLHRRSIRLKNFDYSSPGAYFVTICAYNRQKLFGDILDGQMILNEPGEYAKSCWLAIPEHYPDIKLDGWVVMPDHIHGIIWIMKSGDNFQIQNRFQHIIPHSIGCIVRGFKIGVTKWYRERVPGMVVWQRNYYEHIIRSEGELMRIRKYIANNPRDWVEGLKIAPDSLDV